MARRQTTKVLAATLWDMIFVLKDFKQMSLLIRFMFQKDYCGRHMEGRQPRKGVEVGLGWTGKTPKI